MSFHTIDDGRGIFPQLCVEIDVTNQPTNPTRAWTDVTTDILSLQYTVGGRSDELQQSQPGTLTAVFKNLSSKYDPLNGSGLGIKRRQWLRVRAQWNSVVYPRWMGIISGITQAWPEAGLYATATVTANDALKVANLFDLYGTTFASQASDQRVAAIATLLGIPSNLLDSGASTLVAISTAMPVGSLASTNLTDVESTENGLVFADRDGLIQFQSRHYRPIHAAVSGGTIGDNAGEIPYTDPGDIVSDDAYICSVSYITPTNADGSSGTVQSATNTTSESKYFPSALTAMTRTILSSDVNEAKSCAQYLVNKYGDPSPRVPAAEVVLDKATSQWPTVLAAANSTRFTYKRRAANTFAEDVFVEQVSEEIKPNTSWRTTFQLSPATDQTMWVLGDAVNGVLGTTTRVGY